MPESDENRIDDDKLAPILQATFQHYCGMAMDHHTKAGTTSNILLAVVGATIVLIGIDKEICGKVDLAIAGLVIFIGLFGAAWAWKQIERYYYWESIAEQYHAQLTNIDSRVKARKTYDSIAEDYAAEESTIQVPLARTLTSWISRRHDRTLWVTLHLIVVLIGIGLLVSSARNLTCPAAA